MSAVGSVIKRILISFPFTIAFLIGVSSNAVITWFALPEPDVPAVVDERYELIDRGVPQPEGCGDEELKEIYSIVIGENRNKSTPVRIAEFTMIASTDRPTVFRDIPRQDPRTTEDYEVSDREPLSLRGLLGMREDVVFLTKEEAKALVFEDIDDARSYETVYSNRVVYLSNVGYNSDGTKAAVYVTHYCGGLCAGGSYYVLQKVNGRWVMAYTARAWVS